MKWSYVYVIVLTSFSSFVMGMCWAILPWQKLRFQDEFQLTDPETTYPTLVFGPFFLVSLNVAGWFLDKGYLSGISSINIGCVIWFAAASIFCFGPDFASILVAAAVLGTGHGFVNMVPVVIRESVHADYQHIAYSGLSCARYIASPTLFLVFGSGPLGYIFGWRLPHFYMGILALGLPFLFINIQSDEPKAPVPAAQMNSSYLDSLKMLLQNKAYVGTLLVGAIQTGFFNALNDWSFTFFVLEMPDVNIPFVLGVTGLIGGLGAVFISSALVKFLSGITRNPTFATVAIGQLFVCAFLLGTLFFRNLILFGACNTVAFSLMAFLPGLQTGCIILVVQSEVRARGIALNITCAAIVSTLSPFMFSLVPDRFAAMLWTMAGLGMTSLAWATLWYFVRGPEEQKQSKQIASSDEELIPLIDKA